MWCDKMLVCQNITIMKEREREWGEMYSPGAMFVLQRVPTGHSIDLWFMVKG